MGYTPKTAKKAYYNRQTSPLEKSLNLKTAEASDIEDTNLFNDDL